MPFEIPKSWVWVRFSDIANRYIGKTPERGNARYWNEHKYHWVSISDMSNYGIINETKEFISEEASKIMRKISPKGSLIMSFKLTVGKTSILNIDAFHNEAIITIIPYVDNENALRDYLFTFLPLITQYGNSVDAIKGITLNSTSIANLLIPLPPLNEQKRIVAKIEELLPLVDEYSKAQEALDKLNAKLPDDLRKSILQQAIEGKLVPQDPNDEPASELLKHINPNLSASCDNPHYENAPFEIPKKWSWCKLGDLFVIQSGLGYNKENLKIKSSKMIRVLRGGNINYGKWNNDSGDIMISSQFVKDELLLQKDTFITPAVTSLENIGKTALIEECYDDMVVGGFVLMMKFLHSNCISSKYLLHFFCSNYYINECKKITHKSGQAFYNLSRQKMMDILIPMPPLNEQKRIVAKIEQLFSTLDTITTLLK